MNNKRWMRLLPLMTTMLLVSCGIFGDKKVEVVEVVDEKVAVTLLQVDKVDVEQLRTFTGTVEAAITNNIAPQSPGRISKIFVEVGDRVSKGQVLVDMDKVSLIQRELQMDNDALEFDRVDKLYQIGGVSRSEWDMRKLAYEISKASYDNLKENVVLVSPISGMVMQRNYDSGDMYSGGQPIYVVEKINTVKMMINVSEGLYTRIKKGMEVDVMFDVYGEEKFAGKVKIIYPSIDPQSRTFPVEITIPNAKERIRPGMFSRVTIGYGIEQRVIVPDQAVIKQPGSGERFVYVYRDGVALYEQVVLGRLIGSGYEVVSGLEDGDQVITSRLNLLNNGMEVEIFNK